MYFDLARTVVMILLIEDRAETRELMAAVLRFAGHVVETAAHGQDALDRLATVAPDAIFSDLDMPELDGRALRRLLLASPALRDIPFVVVSAEMLSATEAAGLEVAATLLKPVAAEDLVSCAKLFDRAGGSRHNKPPC